MRVVLGLAVELWTFGSPGGLQILTFSKCWASPPHLAKVGLRHLCVRVARGSSQHQRCSNYALTTLCGLCASSCEWISLSILPSPIPELQHAPLPLKVLWARERVPTPPSSTVFHLDSHLSPSRSWECVILNNGGNIIWKHLIYFSLLILLHIALFEPLAFIIVYWCKEDKIVSKNL
jgi:hypothetical protein